jgi:streptogramin lyase
MWARMSLYTRLALCLAVSGAATVLSACGSPQQTASALPAQARIAAVRRAAAPVVVVRTFTAGTTPGFLATAFAYDITLGPDGNMWFTDGGTPAIGKITPDGKVTEYKAGMTRGARPYAIAAGPDGNMWFSDECGGIGKVTPNGKITEYSIDGISTAASPNGIASSGGAIWTMAQGPPNLLIRVDVANGNLKAYPTPAKYSFDGSLAADAAGNLWTMGSIGENGIMIERKPQGAFVFHWTGLVHAATLCCPNYAPRRIVIGPDGNPWYTTLYWLRKTEAGNVIATTSASGTTIFPVDKPLIPYTAYPSGIAVMNKHVWFSGDDPFAVNGGLWRMNENGKQIAFPVAANPVQIAPDGAGNMWMTAEGFDHPAQIVEVVDPK